MNKSTGGRLNLTFFGIVELAIGVTAIFCGALVPVKTIRSKWWPSVEGKILDVKLIDKSTYSRPSGRYGRVFSLDYRPRIAYSYTVDEVPYTSDRRCFGEEYFLTAARAARAMARYHSGDVVEVRYDANEPSNSVLETGLHLIDFLWISFGLFFLFGAACELELL